MNKDRTPIINRRLMMADSTKHYSVVELNTYSDQAVQPDPAQAQVELDRLRESMRDAGIEIVDYPAPENCQDGLYVANVAFCDGDTVMMGSLPGPRRGEEEPARNFLQTIGKSTQVSPSHAKTNIVTPPYRYSGQGDTLTCGDLMFVGTGYRSDERMAGVMKQLFGPKYREIVDVRSVPMVDGNGEPVVNELSGWPDSEFYDIDLNIAILRPRKVGQRGLIAWCPEAFLPESRAKIENIEGLDKIVVAREEAVGAFACNLVSTGHDVFIGEGAPNLERDIRSHGLDVHSFDLTEVQKGGGSVRCVTLALDN